MEYKPQLSLNLETVHRLHPLVRLSDQQRILLEEISHEEAEEEKMTALVKMQAEHDHHTLMHVLKVANYSTRLAELVGFHPKIVRTIAEGATLHDIGKIAIPASILNKTEPLSEEEIKAIIQHSEIGGIVLKHTGLPHLAMFAAYHHAGNSLLQSAGYSSLLKRDPHVAVVSLADNLEAMLDPKHARQKNLTLELIIKIIEDKFDRGLFPQFLRLPFQQFLSNGYLSQP